MSIAGMEKFEMLLTSLDQGKKERRYKIENISIKQLTNF